MTHVYALWVFDSMASDWGKYELHDVYQNEVDANAKRDEINARIRSSQPHNKYPSLARVDKMELK